MVISSLLNRVKEWAPRSDLVNTALQLNQLQRDALTLVVVAAY